MYGNKLLMLMIMNVWSLQCQFDLHVSVCVFRKQGGVRLEYYYYKFDLADTCHFASMVINFMHGHWCGFR